ncbi:methylmalonyl-CoA mutase subunit beta [Aurantibacter sp.]|uniref:methylmalonyl-CoA mutase subunit beta n=1 Tax=Aurantibacter sp. TaxID=2807103 RepID=UPI0035C7B4AD
MSNYLFSEFEAVNAKAWKQKIQVDLKGLDYNETLIWNSPEGIDVKPFYNKEDLEHFPVINSNNSKWLIGEVIFVNDLEKSNKAAIKAIEDGTNSLKFIIPNSKTVLKQLTKNIDLEKIEIQIEPLFFDVTFFEQNKTILNHKNVTIHHDCIGQLTKDGNWFTSKTEDFLTLEKIIILSKSITIKAEIYQNSGATITQELAYTISHLNEYFNFIENNSTLKTLFKTETLSVFINISIGSNYFFEIAKVRSLKQLVNSLSDSYGFKTKLYINATPSYRNKTLYDYNVNMLRTTTECMSAILGGANTIFNQPYDAIYHKSNAFGNRISRNQLLVLQNESYFNEVNNPSDGSYYIENLTHQLSEKSLSLFKEIEASNGYIDALFRGTIQQKIKGSAVKEQELFDTKKTTLVGTNKFENKNDKMADNLELFPFLKQNPRKTLIVPIIQKRLSEGYEQNRLKEE